MGVLPSSSWNPQILYSRTLADAIICHFARTRRAGIPGLYSLLFDSLGPAGPGILLSTP